jgi:hypothetical protein
LKTAAVIEVMFDYFPAEWAGIGLVWSLASLLAASAPKVALSSRLRLIESK